jgi:ATP-dependent Clp protease ATP-binding subunit ClpC
LKPGQIVVVDCEGDPADIEKSKLVFRGADKPVEVPDAVPANLGGAAAGSEDVGQAG